jgi:DNA polymerase III subunit epsilon
VVIRRAARAHWREASLAALDFETTGLDLRSDHVLSFSVVPIDQGRISLAGAVYRAVKPPIELPAASIVVHGIRPADIEDSPALEDVADELIVALSGRVLVAHAAWIELVFLNRLLRRRGLRRRREVIDVLELASRLSALEGTARPVPSRLTALAGLYGVPAGRTHHAFQDALTTAQLFLVLAARLQRRSRGNIRDLIAAPKGLRRPTRRPL